MNRAQLDRLAADVERYRLDHVPQGPDAAAVDHAWNLSLGQVRDRISEQAPTEGAPEGNITGLIGPWGIPARTPEEKQADQDHWTAREEREQRDVAVSYAVRALTPVAGAYDLPGFLGTGRGDYGDGIIALAEQLGGYIRNGAGPTATDVDDPGSWKARYGAVGAAPCDSLRNGT